MHRMSAEERHHAVEPQLLESQKSEPIERLAGGIANDNNTSTPPMKPNEVGGHDREIGILGNLRHDWIFRFAAAVFLLVALPFVIPGLDEDFVYAWRTLYADPILYAVALLAVVAGLGQVESEREKRFWRFVAFAVGTVVAVEFFMAFASDGMWNNPSELATQTLFLCFYLGLALALEASRSHIEDAGIRILHWIRTVSIGIFLVALLVYFEIIPATLLQQESLTWQPAFLIYVALDSALCFGFLAARKQQEDRRWKSILGGMALVMGVFALVDLAEALFYLSPVPWWELAPVWDLLWFVPIALMVVVARFHLKNPRTEPEPTTGMRTDLFTGGPLVAYTLFLPVLHFVLSTGGFVDPRLDESRGVLVVLVLVLMGTLTLIYQRKVEKENKAVNEQLRLGHERYQSFIASSAEGIYLADLTEPIPLSAPVDSQIQMLYERIRMTEANDVMARMYGMAGAADFIGKTLVELHGNTDDPTNLAMLKEMVEAGYKISDALTTEYDVDGNEKFFENSILGVIEDGYLLRLWGTQVDVTEKRRAEVEKEHLEAELRHSQKMETIGTLAGGIAHDFNNVLAPILGFAELAAEETSLEQIRDHLAHIRRAGTRAQELVEQILKVSRKAEGTRRSIFLQDVVAEALELLRPSLPATIEIQLDLDSDCPPVHADATQLHQVVMNLGTNAYQAMEQTGGRLTLSIERIDPSTATTLNLAPHEYVLLSVSDEGPGIAADVVPKVFDPFFTTKDVGKGTGLGLSVVHGIVISHGGEVRFETAPHRGTQFNVFLPTTDIRPDSMPVERPPRTAPNHARIILVDDESAVAAVASAMLTDLGYDVETFVDSRDALTTIRQSPGNYDILVTDHTMPHVTGPQLAMQARAVNPELGVVIMSGYRLADAPDVGDEFEYLSKPFTKAQLSSSVQQAQERVLVRTSTQERVSLPSASG